MLKVKNQKSQILNLRPSPEAEFPWVKPNTTPSATLQGPTDPGLWV